MKLRMFLITLLFLSGATTVFGQGDIPDKEFPAHKIIGNIYFVGSDTHSSFLITTPEGHILVNTMYERTVPWIRKSVENLGFKFEDIKIILGSHAHVDHMEGDALAKELTKAPVMVMDRDVPLAQNLRPGGKAHPIDRILHDGDTVSLGGTTLVAHLTPGHTPGCTTWTTSAPDGGRNYEVVIIGCIAPNDRTVLVNNRAYPEIVEDFNRSYKFLRTLHPDVYLGSHTEHYNMQEKYARIGKGSNPFVDPQGYFAGIDKYERQFQQALEAQQKAARSAP
jgi:metallo-beta-lactamase class B